VLGNDQPITQRTKLPYLESIMNECLRLYPPVTMLPFRQPAQQDVTLQGTDGPNVIPPHAYISLQIMAIHRNPTMWHNPLEFNVDRWSKDEGVDKRAGFYPFGGGIRTCIGMNFSLLEQRVVLSTLLKHFKWHLPVNSPHTHDMQCTGSLLLKPLPMTVVFTKL
jgi:cytochrome P450